MTYRLLPALLAAAPIAAQAPAVPAAPVAETHAAAPAIRAARVQGPIVLDGRLDEAAWAGATPATGFTQTDPAEGEPASERTEVRVLYDEQVLYIGARLHDSGRVSSRLGRRDASLSGTDWLTVMLDTYHDHTSAFRFQVNPAGVRADVALSSESSGDVSWDPVWDAATSTDEGGWTAEIRIPLSQLHFSGEHAQTWGVQFARTISRKQEYAVFSFTPKKERGGIARYGHLTGLEGLRPGRRLELLPYVSVRSEHRTVAAGNPFRDGSDQFGGAGVDLKYRLTSNLTANATLNPDFGQVELDPAQVNLTAYEIYFQEKRPFFVESSSVFGFGSGGACQGCTLFYSRRIGARPLGVGLGGALYSNLPDATTILGAAKLTGKTRNGWSIGVLNAMTSRETAPFVDRNHERRTSTVEPFTHYFVGRLRKDLRRGQTTFGGMLTAVNRDLSTPLLAAELRSGAYAGGIDFTHEWARRNWGVSASAAFSHIAGSREVITAAQRSSARYYQRPDARYATLDSTATSLGGYIASLGLFKEAGLHWRGGLLLSTTSPGYEINDLGFQSWADRLMAQSYVVYMENRPGKVFRYWNVNPGVRSEWNYDGDRLTTAAYLSASGQLRSYWGGNLYLRRSFGGLDDRLTRGGPLTREVPATALNASVNSDSRRRVTLNGSLGLAQDDAGGWRVSLSPNVGAKPAATWNLSLGPSLSLSHAPVQYVAQRRDSTATHTSGSRYIFAGLDQTTVGVSARLNVTFTPALTLELYAQPYVSSGDYYDLKELHAPRTRRFDRYGEEVGTLSRDTAGFYHVDPDGRGPAAGFRLQDRDFNYLSLRGNAVLRWEWRPGSTLFLVWQQQRSHYGSIANTDPLSQGLGRFDIGRDVGDLFGLRPDNVLLLKVNYWLNP